MINSVRVARCASIALAFIWPASAVAQTVTGYVQDQTGTALPGVYVEIRDARSTAAVAVTDRSGAYRADLPTSGSYAISFSLVNFATFTRPRVDVRTGQPPVLVNVVLHLALSADVTVTGKATFTNLADAERPAENLVGIAQSASQGAITSRQLDTRPLTRVGEVLETVPGVVISQHSGEGKANQYYLRGFNLDHGTDFATTVAGMPVNLPTHGHGHGYSDLSFLIPELVSGIQFSKGPYFADQGDFATAGSAVISYVNSLEKPLVQLSGGDEGYGRVLAAGSAALAGRHLLGAVEVEHNDGPWKASDDYRKLNGLVRFSGGDAVNGVSITAMAYRGRWNASDQVPQRAVADGRLPRFGTVDETDGGESSRYSGSLEWQRTTRAGATKVVAYGIASDLRLFSNFTFFLEDPEHGDQLAQTDRRFTSGVKLTHRRIVRWAGRTVQNTFGGHIRNDNISSVGLYHTEARRWIDTIREDSVLQTSGAVFAQNEVQWTPRLRSLVGIRADRYRFGVDAGDRDNSGIVHAGIVSPKGGVAFELFKSTELYANAGFGFHSNDGRGATITRDPSSGEPVKPVTPLVRAKGTEIGLRTVAVPHLQSTITLWALSLASELLFVGDAGTTDAGRPSRRHGIEWTNYYAPTAWLTIDADIALSRARFRDNESSGDRIPGAIGSVVSAGASIDHVAKFFGGVRLRSLGRRALTEDDTAHSRPTSLTNAQIGYRFSPAVRLVLDIFNVLDAADSDIDYFYSSRLPGEPAGGISDIHFHPVLPRTARMSVVVGF